MSDLSERIKQLEAELAAARALEFQQQEDAIRAAREQTERERYKPIVCDVQGVAPSRRYVSILLSETRDDIEYLLRGVYGRGFTQGGKQNSIPIREWRATIARLAAAPNLSVTYHLGAAEEIDAIIDGPQYLVEMGFGCINITVGPFGQDYRVNAIPSAKKQVKDEFHTVSLAEAHLVFEYLQAERVTYSEDAVAYIELAIKRRNMLDLIAQKSDSDWHVELAHGNELKPFQRVACEFGDVAEGNFILADEMGLGKTPDVIALALKNKWRALIIAPASLKTNWFREIEKFAGVRATVYQGAAPDEYDMIKMCVEKPQFNILNYDILGRKIELKKPVVDAEGNLVFDEAGEPKELLVNRWLWAEVINAAKFDIIITDEGHYLKNVDSQRSQVSRLLKAPRFTVITGTPVLNRPGELWALLALVAPNQFPNYESFVMRYTHNGKLARNVDELRSLIKPYMIRRLKRDLIAELPPINRVYEYHELSKDAFRRYLLALEDVYELVRTYDPSRAGDQQKITNILVRIMRLKQICSDDKIEQTCETAINAFESSDPDDPNRKIIVFSQFVDVVKGIAGRLREDGVVSFTGEDNMHARTMAEDAFQNDPSVSYLITTPRVASEGLNLTRAGTVIFNDFEWTPARHEQAEARAYGRLSNLHSVTSKYIAATNPDGSENIEEWMQELLQRKMRIITEVVEGVASARDEDSSIVTDIIKKLRDQMGRR